MNATSPVGQLKLLRQGGVVRIAISHPTEHNALTVAMKRQLVDSFHALDMDAAVRCIVLQGEGNIFACGVDMSEFETVRSDAPADAQYLRLSTAALLAPARSDKPVVASIRGNCSGAGLQLAVACDVRIAARNASFQMPIARMGAASSYPGLSHFVALIGPSRTADLFMGARAISAEEALALGLVNQVVAEDELDDVVNAYAANLARLAPLTQKLVKNSIRAIVGTGTMDTPLAIAQLAQACGESQDMVEGRSALLEGREPRFLGH